MLLSQEAVFLCFLWNWTFNRMKSTCVLLNNVHRMMTQLQTESVFRRQVFNVASDILFRAVLTVIWNFVLVSLCSNISWSLNILVFNLKTLRIILLDGFFYFIIHHICFFSFFFLFLIKSWSLKRSGHKSIMKQGSIFWISLSPLLSAVLPALLCISWDSN